MQPLTHLETIVWTAGFLEGEGSFVLMKSRRDRPRVACSQVNREPLDFLLNSFGGTISVQRREGRPGHGNRRDLSQWTLDGEPAVQLMGELLPYLSVTRRAQISAVLDGTWEQRPVRVATDIRLRADAA